MFRKSACADKIIPWHNCFLRIAEVPQRKKLVSETCPLSRLLILVFKKIYTQVRIFNVFFPQYEAKISFSAQNYFLYTQWRFHCDLDPFPSNRCFLPTAPPLPQCCLKTRKSRTALNPENDWRVSSAGCCSTGFSCSLTLLLPLSLFLSPTPPPLPPFNTHPQNNFL